MIKVLSVRNHQIIYFRPKLNKGEFTMSLRVFPPVWVNEWEVYSWFTVSFLFSHWAQESFDGGAGITDKGRGLNRCVRTGTSGSTSGSDSSFFNSRFTLHKVSMAKYKPWLVCCFTLAGLTCAVALVCLCVATFMAGGCPRGSFRHAAVAADSRICSEIGR